MPEFFPCLYLGAAVECTDERYAHVLMRHNDFAPAYWGRVAETLFDPDQVRASKRDASAVLLFRWYAGVSKYVIVVVNIDTATRRWLMTAHFVKEPEGELLWAKG